LNHLYRRIWFSLSNKSRRRGYKIQDFKNSGFWLLVSGSWLEAENQLPAARSQKQAAAKNIEILESLMTLNL
jgi:hypothetical protein